MGGQDPHSLRSLELSFEELGRGKRIFWVFSRLGFVLNLRSIYKSMRSGLEVSRLAGKEFPLLGLLEVDYNGIRTPPRRWGQGCSSTGGGRGGTFDHSLRRGPPLVVFSNHNHRDGTGTVEKNSWLNFAKK